MNTLPLVLNLVIAQGLMGAFDTLYHHELRAALPQQTSAALELRIHAGRSLVYGILFVGLAWLVWGGVWLAALAVMLLTEVVLTLHSTGEPLLLFYACSHRSGGSFPAASSSPATVGRASSLRCLPEACWRQPCATVLPDPRWNAARSGRLPSILLIRRSLC